MSTPPLQKTKLTPVCKNASLVFSVGKKLLPVLFAKAAFNAEKVLVNLHELESFLVTSRHGESIIS